MGQLLGEHLGVLFGGQCWRDNPVAMRDARRDTRHNRLFYSIVTLCMTLLIATLFVLSTLRSGYNREPHIPDYLGGSYGGGLALFVSGIHFWFVMRAAQKRVAKMLLQEAALDGMTSMLMLPSTRFQFLVQAAVYPWLSAMGVALLLLPVYLFCVGLEGLTWAELFSLYTFFALLSIVVPRLRRPALSGNIVASLTNPAEDDPEAEAGGSWFSLRRQNWRAAIFWLLLVSVVPVLLIYTALYLFGARGALTAGIDRYVPASILDLLPTFFLSVPLMAARTMITSFGWFGTNLMPLPLVVLFVLGRKYLQIVRTSEYLSVGTYRDLATQPSYLLRRRMELLLNLLQAVVITGFLWPWAVRDSGLEFLALRPGTPGSGLQGFVYLVVFATCWWGWIGAGQLGSWMSVFGPGLRAETPRVVAGRSAAVFLATPLLVGLGYGVLCLTLSGQFALPAGTGVMVLHMLGIGVSAMLLNFGWRRITGSGGVLSALCFYLVLWQPNVLHFLFFLSPTLGLIRLGSQTLGSGMFSGTLSWQTWCWVEIGLGAGCTLVAWLLAYRLRAQTNEGESPTFDPCVVGREVFSDTEANRRSSQNLADLPLSLALVAGFQRWIDNAVAVRELRSRLRSRISTGRVLGVFTIFLMSCLLIGIRFPYLAEIGSLFRDMFDEKFRPGSAADTLANLQGCFYGILPFAAFFCGYGVLPRAFGTERQKSTLSFLLISPMPTSSIIWGKALGLILANSMTIWAVGIWTLALCVPLTVLVGSFAPILGWLGMMVTILVELVTVSMIMLALGSMFPQLTTLRFNGCIRMVVLYIVGQLAMLLWGLFSILVAALHWGPITVWLAGLGVGVLVIVIAGLITYLAVQGMRTGDIDIKLAKKKV